MKRASLPKWLVLALACRREFSSLRCLPLGSLVDLVARLSIEAGFDWRNAHARRGDDRGD